MPLSTVQKTQLVSDTQAVLDAVNALTVDPAVNPLQAQIDAANAKVSKLTDQLTRIVAKVAAADAADVAEDQARADIKSIAAE